MKQKVLAFFLCILLIIPAAFTAFAAEDPVSGTETTYEVGDILYFGSWPQSQVKDEALIRELDKLTGGSVSLNWREGSSQNYEGEKTGNAWDYSDAIRSWQESVNGSSHEADTYTSEDVQYQGETYRRITFSQYRTTDIQVSSDFLTSFRENPESYQKAAPYVALSGYVFEEPMQEASGYYVNTTYYFKYEPLAWRVLDPKKGLLLCENVIDVQPYNNSIYYNFEEISPGYEIAVSYQSSALTPADDYQISSVRDWLYTDFYSRAFTMLEKESIALGEYSYYGDGFDSTELGGEKSPGEKTTVEDYVALPTIDVLTNKNYGFDWTWERSGGSAGYSLPESQNYKAEATDFAKCMGAEWDPEGYDTSSHYLLQDAIEKPSGKLVCCVDNKQIGYSSPASIMGAYITEISRAGIRPMMRVSMGVLGQGWFYEDGVLTIDDNSAMAFAENQVPWAQYLSAIKRIVVNPDVTRIKENAFRNCLFARSAVIKGSVSEVGNNVFNGCNQLEYIEFEGAAPAFADNAFAGINTTVLYPENSTAWKDAIQSQYGGTIRFRNSDGYTAIKDGWATGNDRNSFDYHSKYKIPIKRYKETFHLKGNVVRLLLANGVNALKGWTGNCFGLAALSAASYYGVYNPFGTSGQKWFSETSYLDTFGNHFYVTGKGDVRDTIERALLLQMSSAVARTGVYEDQDKKDSYYMDLLTDIEEGKTGPLVVKLCGNADHAVVLVPSMLPVYLDDDPEWGTGWVKLALYDPNTPVDTAFDLDMDYRADAYDHESYLYLNTETGDWKLNTYDKKTGYLLKDKKGKYKDSGAGLPIHEIVFYDISKLDAGYLDGSKKSNLWITNALFVGSEEENVYKENAKVLSFESNGTFTITDEEGTIISVQENALTECRSDAALDFISDGEEGNARYLAGFIGKGDITISGDVTDVAVIDLPKEQGFQVSADGAATTVISSDCSRVSVNAVEKTEVSVTCVNAERADSVAAVTQVVEAGNNVAVTMEEDNLVLEAPEGTAATLTYTNDEVTSDNEVTIGAEPETIAIETLRPQITDAGISLSKTAFSYTGKAINPVVTVTDQNGNILTAGTDYTVEFRNNTNVGTASVICTGIGNYTGTVTKTSDCLPFRHFCQPLPEKIFIIEAC